MKDLLGHPVSLKLREQYIEPPFTVLRSYFSSWINRRRQWLSLGIQSELGRNSSAFSGGLPAFIDKCKKSKNLKRMTSIFDSVLCEIIYRWFCPEGGRILDPFAGGSVRGIVAGYLGYNYIGIDLSTPQVQANEEQSHHIFSSTNIITYPLWIDGDAEKILPKMEKKVSLVFSCPPYMNLEKFSNHPDDLSNMDDVHFVRKYEMIIRYACRLLKPNGFACFVVGDVRDKKGYLKDFPTITKQAFYKIGMKLYNEAILLNSIGSAAIRVSYQFPKGRKLVKIHQTVLIFKKVKD
jgi:DNA modification methylase